MHGMMDHEDETEVDQQAQAFAYPLHGSQVIMSMPSVIASSLYDNLVSPTFLPQGPHHPASPQLGMYGQWPVLQGGGQFIAAHVPHYARAGVAVQQVPVEELYGPGPPIVTGETVRGPEGCNLFIFHLPNEMTNWDMYNLFKRFGTILSVHIMINKQTGLSRGFGFVSYQARADADQAIKAMNGFRIGNKRLKVQHKRKAPRGGADFASGSDERGSTVYDSEDTIDSLNLTHARTHTHLDFPVDTHSPRSPRSPRSPHSPTSPRTPVGRPRSEPRSTKPNAEVYETVTVHSATTSHADEGSPISGKLADVPLGVYEDVVATFDAQH